MGLDANIYSALSGVGVGAPIPVYPDLQADPSEDPPPEFVVYSRVSLEPTHDLDDDGRLDRVRYQIDVYSPQKDAALVLASQVRGIMTGIGGRIATSFGDYEPTRRLYRISQDFMLWDRF